MLLKSGVNVHNPIKQNEILNIIFLCYFFQITVPYHCISANKSNYAVLNRSHSYFLLVDNGTVGKYGGEVIFRKRLEKYIAQQKISIGKFLGQANK